MKRHVENLTFEDRSGNRSFWKAIKPYLTNNGNLAMTILFCTKIMNLYHMKRMLPKY